MTEKVTVKSLAEKLRNRPRRTTYWPRRYETAEVDQYLDGIEGDFAQLQKQLATSFEDFPMLDEHEAYPILQRKKLLDYIGKVGEWLYKTKEEILGKEGET